MKETFSNLPIDEQIAKKDSGEGTIDYFDNFNKQQLAFKASTSDAVIAFFKGRGMQESAAKSVSFIFLKQKNWVWTCELGSGTKKFGFLVKNYPVVRFLGL